MEAEHKFELQKYTCNIIHETKNSNLFHSFTCRGNDFGSLFSFSGSFLINMTFFSCVDGTTQYNVPKENKANFLIISKYFLLPCAILFVSGSTG